jgi:tetratricopeptide (TPR) repeat protein
VEEWQGALHIALAATRHLGDRQAEADTISDIAVAYYDMQRYDDSLSHHQRALTLYEELGDRANAATTLSELGGVSVGHKRYHEAIAYLDRALPDVASHEKGVTINYLGRAYAGLERHDEAIGYYHDALARHNETGDSIAEGFTLHNLGDAYAGPGQARRGNCVLQKSRRGATTDRPPAWGSRQPPRLGHGAPADRRPGGRP